MPLVDARGFQLSPNIGQSFGQGVAIKGELQRQQLLQQQSLADQQAAQAALDKEARLQGIFARLGAPQQQQVPQQALGGQAQPLPQLGQQPAQLGAQATGAQPAQLGAQQAPQIPFGRAKAMADLAIQFPEKFEQISKNLGLITQNQKDSAANFAFKLRNTPVDQRPAMIDQREAEIRAMGGDPTHTISLRGMPEEAQNQALEIVEMAALSGIQRQEVAEGTRAFGLDKQKFGLDQANVFSQIRERDAPKIPKKTTIEKNLNLAGFETGTEAFEKEVLKFIQKPVGVTVNTGDTKTLSKASEGQLASAGFANRVANANSDIENLEDSGYDPTNLIAKIGATIPGGNFVLSEDDQLYQAAKEDLITAVLRDESGATIGTEEFIKEEKKLFPQPGDGPKTIAAKRIRRQRTLENLVNQSKGVYSIQYQTPAEARKEAPDNIGTATVTPVEGGKYQMRIIK